MLKFAFDESNYQSRTGVCAIAGYVGTLSRWKVFDRKWSGIVERRGIGEVHASLIWSRSEGPFADWPDEDRVELINDLVTVIRKCNMHLLASGISLDDFFALDEERRRYLTGAVLDLKDMQFIGGGSPDAPYFVPFQYCVVQGAKRAENGDLAHFVFDEQDEFRPYALERFVYMKAHPSDKIAGKMGDLVFTSSKRSPGVQAADLAVYVCRRMWENRDDDLTKYACQRIQERDISHKLFRANELNYFLEGYERGKEGG